MSEIFRPSPDSNTEQKEKQEKTNAPVAYGVRNKLFLLTLSPANLDQLRQQSSTPEKFERFREDREKLRKMILEKIDEDTYNKIISGLLGKNLDQLVIKSVGGGHIIIHVNKYFSARILIRNGKIFGEHPIAMEHKDVAFKSTDDAIVWYLLQLRDYIIRAEK